MTKKHLPVLMLMTSAVLAVILVIVTLALLYFRPSERVVTIPEKPARPALAYQSLPDNLVVSAVNQNLIINEDRATVVASALSIVGEVGYFWGGKSEVIGKDPLWGEPMLVDSDGSESSGTYQPFGLDCSGYISWCFLQCGMGFDRMQQEVGNGTSNQWRMSNPVEWDDLIPGDIVFQHAPGHDDGNHVGIVVGFDDTGEPLIAHCSYSLGGVVVTGRGDIFSFPRRPQYYGDEDFLLDSKR